MSEARFHPEAVAEMIEAAQFYETRQPGLGSRFLDAVEFTARQLERQPTLGRVDSAGRRRRAVKRFPYRLIYREKASDIFILAIAHGSRRPGYWRQRES